MCLSNKFLVFISLLILASTQLVAAPPENPPPIEVDVFVTNDEENPVPVEVINDSLSVNVSTEPQFAGYTVATTSGVAGGYSGMNALCQAEFGEHARMCTTKEWFNTHGTRKPPPGEKAWVQPVLASTLFNPITSEVIWLDWTGISFSSFNAHDFDDEATCAHWGASSPSRSAAVVFGGRPFKQQCHLDAHVTCCSPSQVTADF